MDDDLRPHPQPDGGEFVAGLLAGALVGAAVAMVLTPQSGEDLRYLMRTTVRRAKNHARDVAKDLGDCGEQRSTTP